MEKPERVEIGDLGAKCLSLIYKRLEKEITMEEYYSELTLLDRQYPGHHLKEGAEVMMRHKNKLDKLPPPEAWKQKGFTLGSQWRRIDEEPQLPPKEAELFEQKREIAKSKFRYEED